MWSIWQDRPVGEAWLLTESSLLVYSRQRASWFECVWATNTSSAAQGGGGSFKNRKPIREAGCCESGMAERSHWWTERCLRSPLFLSLSLTIYLPTYPSMYLSIYRSISVSLSLSLFHLITCLSTYLPISLSLFHLSICLAVYLSICGAVSFSVI